MHTRGMRTDAAGRWALGILGVAKISSSPNSDGSHQHSHEFTVYLGSVSLYTENIYMLSQVEIRYHCYLLPFSNPHPQKWATFGIREYSSLVM